MRQTRHLNTNLSRTSKTPISEWLSGDNVFLPLTLKVSPSSRGKYANAVSTTSAVVDSGDARDNLSLNSRKRQSKINAQAPEITAVRTELNKSLEENKN